MSTQADAIAELAAAPPPTDRGPRVTLQILRVAAVLHSLAFLGQPVIAGAAATPARTTRAGRTPSTWHRASRWTSPCGSATTWGVTCCFP
jgi:hypothetical protein